jgi:hypothetical protein
MPPLHLYEFDKPPTDNIKGTKSCQGKTDSDLIVQKSFEFGKLLIPCLTFLHESIRHNLELVSEHFS